jgi:DNA-binding NarL/FixJ family response regulator
VIHIIICDDQDIVREGLQTILSTEREFTVSATASDGDELIELIQRSSEMLPDLVLMDLKMPIKNGIQATREIKKYWPQIKVLVLTTYADDRWVIDALKAGASGYLLKDTPRSQLIAAIKGTVAGDTYVDPSIAGKLLPFVRESNSEENSPYQGDLTDREQEILLLIAKGLSNTEIGEKLFLSTGTVRNYTSTIFSKLGVSDRTEAAIAGIRAGIFNLSDI